MTRRIRRTTTPLRASALAAAIAALIATLACATHNFNDPLGPRYDGAYAAVALPPADTPLRIVTFNIKFAREIDRALALFRSIGALQAADVVMLQEMDRPGVERLATSLGLNYVYFPSTIHPWSKREFGTAVLSPWPLADARKIVLPYPSFITNARRTATSALVQRGTLRLRVMSVHLPAPGSVNDEERLEQVQRLVDSVAAVEEPVVIAGDFNGRRVGPWFAARGFDWVTKALPGTTRALGRWWSYDHVFVRGLELASHGLAAGIVDPNGASDHRAVWVRLVPSGRAR